MTFKKEGRLVKRNERRLIETNADIAHNLLKLAMHVLFAAQAVPVIFEEDIFKQLFAYFQDAVRVCADYHVHGYRKAGIMQAAPPFDFNHANLAEVLWR